MTPDPTLPSSMNVLPSAHRLRIALVCSRLPLPMTRADQLTVAHLISFLAARGHALDLFTLDTGEKPTPEQRAWLDQRCRQLLVFRQPTAYSILGLMRAVAVGKPMQVGWFTNRAHIHAVRRPFHSGNTMSPTPITSVVPRRSARSARPRPNPT
jgi:hypothetical protein